MRQIAILALVAALGAGCAIARPIEEEEEENDIAVISASVQIRRAPGGRDRIAEVTPKAEFGELLRVLDLLSLSRVKRVKVVVEGGGPTVLVSLVWPKTTQPRLGVSVNKGGFGVHAAPLAQLRKGHSGLLEPKPSLAPLENGQPAWDLLIAAVKAQLAAVERLNAVVILAAPESDAITVLETAQRVGALGFSEGVFLAPW